MFLKGESDGMMVLYEFYDNAWDILILFQKSTECTIRKQNRLTNMIMLHDTRDNYRNNTVSLYIQGRIQWTL